MFTFNIVGIAPILYFFNYQQERSKNNETGITYFSSYRCTLDGILRTLDHAELNPDWSNEAITQAVINFWIANLDSVEHWQRRLNNAGSEVILINRIAQTQALRNELENLFLE